MKDFSTNQVLLRCDSSGDLYPALPVSSKSSVALLNSSPSLWHQLLGHPGAHVFGHLISSRSMPCNKHYKPISCRACNLGKHIRLPFYSSSSTVNNCFDIVHSDLWESPVTSISGIKYYIVFLDHFSHFLWVYPLRQKSNVSSKFLHFRAYVKTQFQTEIKTFQCDHGGEYDNQQFHDLFAQNGINFRFSCP